MGSSVYGPEGVVGLLVPPGNPTVEPEMGRLLSTGVLPLTVRMVSAAEAQVGRLRAYHDGLRTGRWLDGFASADLAVVGYACTASAYLVGPDEDAAAAATLEARSGIPVVTAFDALRTGLVDLDARRLGLLSPYPDELSTKCVRSFADLGFDTVLASVRAAGRHGGNPIYRLQPEDVLRSVRELPLDAVDVVVLAGTGMASLEVLLELAFRDVPAVSSNLCLAWAMECRLPSIGAQSLERWIAREAAWHARLGSTGDVRPAIGAPDRLGPAAEAKRAD